MYKAINEIVPDAAFSIFTGDIIDHAVWNTSRSYDETWSKMNAASVKTPCNVLMFPSR